MPPRSEDLEALRRELAAGWRLPDGFDARPAAAFWPYPPEPGKRPTKPGPQPCNQIAGSYEEQLQRVLAAPPDPFRAALVALILEVLRSDEGRQAVQGQAAQPDDTDYESQPRAAEEFPEPRLYEPQPDGRDGRGDRQPGEDENA